MSNAWIQGPRGGSLSGVVTAGTWSTGAQGFQFNTQPGSLLICVLTGENYNQNLSNSNIAVTAPVWNAPSTPGFTWVRATGIDAASVLVPGFAFQSISNCEIWYILNAGVMATTVKTIASALLPHCDTGIGFALYEFSGLLSQLDDSAAAAGLTNIPATANLISGAVPDAFTNPSNNQLNNWACSAIAVSDGIHDGFVFVVWAPNYTISYTALHAGPGFTLLGTSQYNLFAYTGSGGGAGGGSTGSTLECANPCSGPPLLNTIPGFSDLPDSVLAADDPTFALHIGEISFNAAFGMVRTEIFSCILKHGDVVPLPVSCADGYGYAREELLYMWTVRNSTDPSTTWIGAVDSLWFTNWFVDQTTGEVFSEEWYERSSTADSRQEAKTNDGSILVFTIGQRQKTNMIMRALASYTAISESDIATDKPLKQALIQALNDDAKFSVVNSEIFYLGEYVDGDTVTLPVSAVDGYTYSFAECKLMHSWRWTASGAQYIQPPWGDPGPWCDQLGPFKAAVSSVGVVSITVSFVYAGGENTNSPAGFGRIAVFAFCKRSATPGSMSLANNFTEVDVGFFFPGEDLRASTVLAIKRNIDEAILSPEFFGPTEYGDGDTVTLPVSPVDGYTYSRDECRAVWSWSDTKNNNNGGWPGTGHSRVPLFLGSIAADTGLVTLNVWRLPPGGPYEDDYNLYARIRVIVMANRKASHPEIIDNTLVGAPATAGSYTADNMKTLVGDSGSGGAAGVVPAPAAGDAAAFKFLGADGNWAVPGGAGATPYTVGLFYPGSPPFANQLLTAVVLPDAVTFAAGLSPSTFTATANATGSPVFSFQKNGVQFGTLTITAGTVVGIFASASPASFNGTTDILSVIGPATPDATLANLGIMLRGVR